MRVTVNVTSTYYTMAGILLVLASTLPGCSKPSGRVVPAQAPSGTNDQVRPPVPRQRPQPMATTRPTVPPGVNTGNLTRDEQGTELLSQVYQVEGLYRSMMGPHSTERLTVLDLPEPELVWLTGYEAVMVGEDGESNMPQQFMCHSNLDFGTAAHRQRIPSSPNSSTRLFTLSQGQFGITFPAGFGIPMISDEVISLTTQVLNLHDEHDRSKVRHKVRLHVVRDRDLKQPMKPLYPSSAYSLVTLEENGICYNSHDEDRPSCLPGAMAEGGRFFSDRFGRKFSGHWVVPPGKHVYRTDCTSLINLPWDTTVHYIATHLHPFAESLELIDRTTGEIVFKSLAQNSADYIGLDHVDYLSSEEGVPLWKDHEYEIVAKYDNTSGQNQDSMAVLYMYLLDHDFQKPAPAG